MIPESNGCAPLGSTELALLTALDGSSVTVCGIWPMLTQVTVAPRGTVRLAGTNWFASFISTLNTWGAGVGDALATAPPPTVGVAPVAPPPALPLAGVPPAVELP